MKTPKGCRKIHQDSKIQCDSCRGDGDVVKAVWRTEGEFWLSTEGEACTGDVDLCGDCFGQVSGCRCGLLHWDDSKEVELWWLPEAQAKHALLINAGG